MVAQPQPEKLERLFRATFEQAAVGLAHVGLDGRFEMVNDQLCRVLGRDRATLLQTSLRDVVHPDDRDSSATPSRDLIAGRISTYSADKRYIRGDGSVVWAEETVSLVRADDGRPECLVVAVEDMTDRRAAADALRASELKYRALFERTNENAAMFRLERDETGRVIDYTVVDANDAFARSAGASREAVIGKRFTSLWGDPETTRPYVSLGRKVAEEGRPIRTEIGFEPAGITLLLSIFPLDDDLLGATATDITELREAEAQLKRQGDTIRQAYVDVLDAVTGGKLVLLTPTELDESLGETIAEGGDASSPERLANARHEAREAICRTFPSFSAVDDALAAFGEAITNAIKHAGGGWYRVYRKGDSVQLLVADHGPGIDFRNLPRAALGGRFSTTGTLGLGFTIMLQLCGRVLLTTQPGYTAIVLEIAMATSSDADGSCGKEPLRQTSGLTIGTAGRGVT